MTLLQHIEQLEAESVKRSEKALEECEAAWLEVQRAELALIVAEDVLFTWPKIEASRGR
jgi:hypothetical protein